MNAMRTILLATTLILALHHEGLAYQDPVDAGHEELSSRKFPWYDSDSRTIIDLERSPSQKAKSSNRGDIQKRKTKKTTPKNNTNFNTSWFNCIQWFCMGIDRAGWHCNSSLNRLGILENGKPRRTILRIATRRTRKYATTDQATTVSA